MPDQPNVHARSFARRQELFRDGVYVPTREPAEIWSQVPSSSRLCVLKVGEEEDVTTQAAVKCADCVYTWLGKTMIRVRNRPAAQEPSRQRYIKSATLGTAMNVIAATILPAFLASTLVLLSLLKTDKMRIVLLGILSWVLTMSLFVLAPKAKRNELYSITSAYFAVGGIFIGAKSVDVSSGML